ncbi:hypothetical protein ACLKA7_014815 [Drosophila subpalustris]
MKFILKNIWKTQQPSTKQTTKGSRFRIPAYPPCLRRTPQLHLPQPGIISISGIATKINKENAIDDKQLRNTGLSNNYTAYGAGKRQLHTETPWEKS